MNAASAPTPPPLPFMPPRKRTWGQKIGIGFAVLLPLATAFFVVRMIAGNQNPHVVIPPLRAPVPNAFDVFVRAAKEVAPDKASAPTVGDAISVNPKKAWTVAEKESLLDPNAPALARVRGGFSLPYRDATGPRSYETKFPHYAQFRNITRLFVLEGDIKRDNGDFRGAAQSYGDAVVFGQKIAQGAPLIGFLVSDACQAIGRRHLWHLDRLDADTARRTARRLETANQIFAKNAPFADTIMEEKWWGQSTLMDIFVNPKRNPDYPSSGLSYVIWSKQTVMDSYTEFMDRLAVYSKQPYQMHPDMPPIPHDPLNYILLPVFGKARWKSVANDTQNGLLSTALALRSYQADHGGQAPPDLQSLVPRYLSRVPVDPCALPVAPFRYAPLGGGKYLLYSVGPDGKDNSGTPALNDDEKRTESNKYYSTPTSKGDIVAGINLI